MAMVYWILCFRQQLPAPFPSFATEKSASHRVSYEAVNVERGQASGACGRRLLDANAIRLCRDGRATGRMDDPEAFDQRLHRPNDATNGRHR